jgi:hypothetical protein
MVKQLELFDFQYDLRFLMKNRKNQFLNQKNLPVIKQPKCKHCKYSVSRIKPPRGVAQPSLNT